MDSKDVFKKFYFKYSNYKITNLLQRRTISFAESSKINQNLLNQNYLVISIIVLKWNYLLVRFYVRGSQITFE